MELVWYHLCLVAFSIYIPITAAQPGIQCDLCLEKFCTDRIIPLDFDPQCILVFIGEEEDFGEHQCDNCVEYMSVLECTRGNLTETSHRVLMLKSASSADEICAGNLGNSRAEEQAMITIVPPGFFIIEVFRFCVSQCVDRLSLLAENPGSSHMETSIEFYVYKRYSSESEADLFVQQSGNNITLTYNLTLNAFEAKLGGLSICVDRGDYFGLNIKEGIQIFGTNQRLHTEGVFNVMVNSTSMCSGPEAVMTVYPEDVVNIAPLFSFQYLPRHQEVTSAITDIRVTTTVIKMPAINEGVVLSLIILAMFFSILFSIMTALILQSILHCYKTMNPQRSLAQQQETGTEFMGSQEYVADIPVANNGVYVNNSDIQVESNAAYFAAANLSSETYEDPTDCDHLYETLEPVERDLPGNSPRPQQNLASPQMRVEHNYETII